MYLKGKEIVDSCPQLSESSIIHVVDQRFIPEERIQLFIKTLRNDEIEVELPVETLIKDLIEEKIAPELS